MKIHAPVLTIGPLAFSGCISLRRIDIPDSIRSIQNHAFSGCSSLATVNTINSTTKNHGNEDNYYSWHNETASIRLPKTIEYICINSFIGCTLLNDMLDVQTAVYICDIKYAKEFLQKSNDCPIALKPYALVRTPNISHGQPLSKKQKKIRHLSFVFHILVQDATVWKRSM